MNTDVRGCLLLLIKKFILYERPKGTRSCPRFLAAFRVPFLICLGSDLLEVFQTYARF